MRKRTFPWALLVLMLTSIPLLSQKPGSMPFDDGAYKAAWKVIDSLDEQGLPKSALEKVNELYELAQKDNHPAQQAKAVMRISRYKGQLSEDGPVASIAFLEETTQSATFPLQATLQSILAESYMTYLQNRIWQIRERETIMGDPGKDITTWSVDQLLKKSTELYLQSIQDIEALKALPINLFDAITTDGKNADQLRPSLFDFLAHRAVDHFANDLSYITQPAYQFTIQDEAAFAPVRSFVGHKFPTEDEQSFPFITLQLFQDILREHLEDADPVALVDADLKRLQIVHEKAAHPHKDSLYLDALEALAKQYENHTSYAEILAQTAEFKMQQGRLYLSERDEKYRWEVKEAYELCQKAIDKYPKSYGALKCQNFQTSIQEKQLELKIEQVNVPVQPSLLWVGYSNLTDVYVEVIRIKDPDRFSTMTYDEKIQFIKKEKPEKAWSETLPNEGDFQFHSLEIAVPVLEIGSYVIVVSDSKRLKNNKSKAHFVQTTVSQLAYLWRQTPNQASVDFVVVNRSSGAPMGGVKAEFFGRQYNRKKQSYELNKIGESLSDQDGFISSPVQANQYFRVKLSQGSDELFIQDGYNGYNRSGEPKNQQIAHFFTDRAIYRPGQSIYFKAILLEKDGRTQEPKILANENTSISLHDANGQQMKTLELTSNEYGSISGTFTAPASGLLGQMFLRASQGSTHYFRVEEYKRPRFEVTFKPLENQAKLNTEVQINGLAQGFAGDLVQGAQVQYRVVREVRYPWIPWWRRSSSRFPGRPTADMEIANGTTQTSESGTFQIEFQALADPKIDQQNDPAFIFTVYADVTDVTGETHSSQKSIQLAYLGLEAKIKSPESIDRREKLQLAFNTFNLDGQEQAVRGNVVIERLVAPAHPYIDRYWAKPDYHLMDEKTFSQQFPLFAYKEEDEKYNWPVLGSFFQQDINTGTNKQLDLEINDWPVGHYRITFITRDAQNQEIKSLAFFQLFDRAANQIPTDQWLWTKLDREQYEPKDLVQLALASSIENWHLLYEIDRRQKKEPTHWVQMQKWLDLNELVQEDDRGNFHIKMAGVRYNRVFSKSLQITIPWSNKQLQIEYSTFRDKLRPGEDEEWRLKISGPNKEQVAAEMVAGMYDASLDQFVKHNWNFAFFPTYYPNYRNWQGAGFTPASGNRLSDPRLDFQKIPERFYRQLDWPTSYRIAARSRSFDGVALQELAVARSAPPQAEALAMPAGKAAASISMDGAPVPYGAIEAGETQGAGENALEGKAPINPRTNLKETVFFLPELKTDEEGNILITFKMNEALTRWKFLAFAHTKELAYAIGSKEIVTQKELMVLPSPPRFFREGDHITFAAKLSNLTDSPLSGTARLEIMDALNGEVLDLNFGNDQANISFQTTAQGSAGLEWNLQIPKGQTSAIVYRVTARAGAFSDGEEAALPVLTNRMLVTESKPLAINSNQTKTFELEGLAQALSSSTAEAHQFTLEFTSNPAWYAIQALPYLMEYPYECTEQIFNRYYANALASSAANKYPKVRTVFTAWRDQSQEAMLSNLRKNQELKALLLEETPWVLSAKTEEEQKQNIGLLFDLDRMSREEEAALNKLVDYQQEDGGFSWFPGGRTSWHMTQYVLEGIGRLKNLNIADPAFTGKTDQISLNGIEFIDRQLKEQYTELAALVKDQKAKWDDDHLNNLTIHYLYTRSLYNIPHDEAMQEMVNYYQKQAEKFWTKKGIYQQGLIALALLNQERSSETPKKILASLQERALHHEELGMYWKYPSSWYWYQLPIETHALLIEVFSRLQAPAEEVEALKLWLLKNKQTNHWPTTTATASAVYALLNTGDHWFGENQEVKITFPGWRKKAYADKIESAQASAETGTGYFSVKWSGKNIDKEINKIKVKNPNNHPAWGAAYWQYFEDIDKVKTFEETPLTLKKQLFLEKPGDRGPVLDPISENTALHPGDKLVVRLELRVDRAMEYVHMKDTRAAGLEPIQVLSQYRWQDGLGYYESPGDAATNFFFDTLPPGTYVFEYPLRVTYKGDFSNGMTSIQCMYAPEFTSHSAGGKILVEGE